MCGGLLQTVITAWLCAISLAITSGSCPMPTIARAISIRKPATNLSGSACRPLCVPKRPLFTQRPFQYPFLLLSLLWAGVGKRHALILRLKERNGEWVGLAKLKRVAEFCRGCKLADVYETSNTFLD